MPTETIDRCPAPPDADPGRPGRGATTPPVARAVIPAGSADRGGAGSEADDHEGWQALAMAERGRPLNAAELAAVRHLPADIALDLLFPDLSDPARHEALWALG